MNVEILEIGVFIWEINIVGACTEFWKTLGVTHVKIRIVAI